jgi:hypothetical protein
MYIRNHEGKIVIFDWTKYRSEKQIYTALWKILYNITLMEPSKVNENLINYINKK